MLHVSPSVVEGSQHLKFYYLFTMIADRSGMLNREQENMLTVQLGARLRACSSIANQAGTLAMKEQQKDGYFYDHENESELSESLPITLIKSAPNATNKQEEYRMLSSRLLRAHRRMRVLDVTTPPPRSPAAKRKSEGDAVARAESIVTVASARSSSRCEEREAREEAASPFGILVEEGEKVEEGKVDADQVDAVSAARALPHKDSSQELGVSHMASIGDVSVVTENVSSAAIGGRSAIESRSSSRRSARKTVMQRSKFGIADSRRVSVTSDRSSTATIYPSTLRPDSWRSAATDSEYGPMDEYLEKICSDTTVLTEVSMRITSGRKDGIKEKEALVSSMEEWLTKILRRSSSSESGLESSRSTEQAREEIALKLLKALGRLGK